MPMNELETMIFDQCAENSTQLVARAISDLDALLGEGYAAANPTVLAQWLAVAGSQMVVYHNLHGANGLAYQIERLGTLADAIEASAAAAHAGKVQ